MSIISDCAVVPLRRWHTNSAPNGAVLGDVSNEADGAVVDAPDYENPDMSVLRQHRRSPPPFPLDAFGKPWADWIAEAAHAAATPVDYVALPLLASASALIGHARWAQAGPGWIEPPHLWCANVGDSGSGKSGGSDCLQRDVLPEIERSMAADFPDRLREWKAADEAACAAQERWKADVRTAGKQGATPPLPPAIEQTPEPQAPRLRQYDVTIEKVALLLSAAAPKGLLIVRDELAGWLLGMNAYNDAGRQFWLEAYGGRPYRVERVKSPQPIVLPRLAVGVMGTVQPERLSELFRDADDGLLSRFIWAWPGMVPFRLGRRAPGAEWATAALDRLRLLDLGVNKDGEPRPLLVPLSAPAQGAMEAFGQDMQRRQEFAARLMRSAYGKARGLALRLSLGLAMLRWCAHGTFAAPPLEIDEEAFLTACDLVVDYFMPMAERVYGDAAATLAERNTATLARWIAREKAHEVHVRRMQREVRLEGLREADTIKTTCDRLVDAGWLFRPPKRGIAAASRHTYQVNPRVLDLGEAAP